MVGAMRCATGSSRHQLCMCHFPKSMCFKYRDVGGGHSFNELTCCCMPSTSEDGLGVFANTTSLPLHITGGLFP
jgi:hypothetical protein